MISTFLLIACLVVPLAILSDSTPDSHPCPECHRPIRRALVRGKRVGDWTCVICCLAWPELPSANEERTS